MFVMFVGRANIVVGQTLSTVAGPGTLGPSKRDVAADHDRKWALIIGIVLGSLLVFVGYVLVLL